MRLHTRAASLSYIVVTTRDELHGYISHYTPIYFYFVLIYGSTT
jgi:hypothetical protein